jgi:hypothetical protein
MSLEVWGWAALGAALLICIGLLLEATWTTQALHHNLRQRAAERQRTINWHETCSSGSIQMKAGTLMIQALDLLQTHSRRRRFWLML